MRLVATLALAGVALAAFLPADPARADDCLLDTNNDGNADSNVDTDLGADSGGIDSRLACGSNATASGSSSTSIGANSDATNEGASALGNNAQAIGLGSTSLGAASDATQSFASALGYTRVRRAPTLPASARFRMPREATRRR
jgi:hypothetical protein